MPNRETPEERYERRLARTACALCGRLRPYLVEMAPSEIRRVSRCMTCGNRGKSDRKIIPAVWLSGPVPFGEQVRRQEFRAGEVRFIYGGDDDE